MRLLMHNAKNVFENINCKGAHFMKSLKLLGAFLFTLVVISFFSCQIGLGSQVDTATPSAEITYPDPESIIRGSFVIKGSCSDDMGVTKVAVTLGQTGKIQ